FRDAREGVEPTGASLGGVEGRIAELERLAPDRAAELRERLRQQLRGALLKILDRPGLTPDDVARVEQGLDALAGRDPEAVPGLRQRLAQRARAWEPLFDLRAPFTGWDAVFDATEARVEGGRLVPRRTAAGPEGPVA